jgi:hypothetical protein
MTTAARAFETFLPLWRASIPPSIPLAYFDDFVLRMRPTLETIVGAFFERRQARRDQALPPDSMTKASRTRRNLEAMRIVATRRPQDMNADERRAVLGYSGWGGLSIEAVMDQFPPGLVPDDFALAHEYFTPPPVAGEISDLVCRYLPELAGFDGIVRAFEPSVGIGRLIHPMGPPRCLVTDPRYKETRWTAVELSEVSAKMFAAMRPDVELYAMSLERWMSEHAARYQGRISCVVSNPPYGGRGEYALQDKHPDYQERAAYAYFMRRCLDLLVPRGLGVFVIPAGFLTGSTNRSLRERVLLRHHLEVAFRLPSESTTGKDLFPGAHNVVDVVVWRARGGELRQVDPGDGFIVEGDYFKENAGHILGTEVEEEAGKKRRRYAVVGDFAGFPAFTPRPVCESCTITNLPTFEVTPVTTVTRDMGEDPGDAGDDLRQALDLGRRVDRYLALVAAEDPRATGLWRELSEALQNLKRAPALAAHDGNPWRWPELRALAERRALAQRLLAAYQKTGELSPAVAQAPNIQPKFRAQPGDVLAQGEHLHRSRRRLTIDELEAFHKAQGGLLDRAFMVRQLLDAEWNLDGDDWDELVPARAYLGGMLWPKYDRAAARAPTDPTGRGADAPPRGRDELGGVRGHPRHLAAPGLGPADAGLRLALRHAQPPLRRHHARTRGRHDSARGQRLRKARYIDGADARDPVVPRLDEPRLHPLQARSQRRRDPEAGRGGRGRDGPVRHVRVTRTKKTRRPTRRRTSARSACCSGATGIASSPPGCAPRRTARSSCATPTTGRFAASSSPPTTAARWTSRAGTRPARSSRPTRSPASCACSTCAGA